MNLDIKNGPKLASLLSDPKFLEEDEFNNTLKSTASKSSKRKSSIKY